MGTSPESCDHLRQAIDDEISSLEESTRALKSRQNELASISRLSPETLAAIFFFLSLSTWRDEMGNMTWIRVAHVCRLWRKVAFNHPRFWSHINLTKLTPVGVAEILGRVGAAPLHLEVDLTAWGAEQIVAFEKQLETHISHTRHLSIRGGHLPTLLEHIVSSAPILEFLSLAPLPSSPQVTIPNDIFNCTTPSLINLELESCDNIWMSPFHKGLRSLRILKLSTEAKPKLEEWLDALNEMPQLEELFLQSAAPLAPLTGPLISEPPSRSATLPSLTWFNISDTPKECALAMAHLMLPALTRLHVEVRSEDWTGGDVRRVIPYVARNVCGIQDIEPLRSVLFTGEEKRTEIVAWTMPETDIKVRNPTTLLSESVSARLMFTATGNLGMDWTREVAIGIYDALFALLPVESVSTFSALNHTRLSKEFWLNQAPRLPSLERVCLVPTAVKAFRDMLAEDAPPDGPRLPSLTKLTIFYVTWTPLKTYHFRDMLIERAGQGVPLESLDLRACEVLAHDHASPIFAEIVVDMQESRSMSWSTDASDSEWHAATESRREVEYDDDWNDEPWYGFEYPEGEEVYDDYVGPFDGIDFANIREELDPEDGLPYGW